MKKGRGWKRVGVNNNKAKLTLDDVNYARTVKASAAMVAKALGVHPCTIYRIRNGTRWSQILA